MLVVFGLAVLGFVGVWALIKIFGKGSGPAPEVPAEPSVDEDAALANCLFTGEKISHWEMTNYYKRFMGEGSLASLGKLDWMPMFIWREGQLDIEAAFDALPKEVAALLRDGRGATDVARASAQSGEMRIAGASGILGSIAGVGMLGAAALAAGGLAASRGDTYNGFYHRGVDRTLAANAHCWGYLSEKNQLGGHHADCYARGLKTLDSAIGHFEEGKRLLLEGVGDAGQAKAEVFDRALQALGLWRAEIQQHYAAASAAKEAQVEDLSEYRRRKADFEQDLEKARLAASKGLISPEDLRARESELRTQYGMVA